MTEVKMTSRDRVKSLIAKAERAHDAGEAMKFSQAALNAANAISCLLEIEDDLSGRGNAARGK